MVVDASACMGMFLPTGVGEVKHCSTKQPRAQWASHTNVVDVQKVPCAEIASDIMIHAFG